MDCPRCGPEGKMVQWRVDAPEQKIIIWACLECDAAWEDPDLISKANLKNSFDTILEDKYGINHLRYDMTIVGDFWLIWYDKTTHHFVGKKKLNIFFEEPRHFDANHRFVSTIKLEGISLENLLEVFGSGIKEKNPTIYLYDRISTLNTRKVEILQPCTDVKIDLEKYYYFAEFDSPINGKISAEDENYPEIFLPRLGLL